MTARNALMAGRHVPKFLMYRSNYYDTEQPFRGNFFSDITDVMDRKIEVIKAHQSELERVRGKWVEFFTNQNSNDGQKIGVDYAECFEVVRYLI
jgi:LmbE family N-acetylglucosaminyl deacetylase